MDIQYLGHSSFKIKGKTGTIVTDPFDPAMIGLKFPPCEADIVTISHDHADHNQAKLVNEVKRVIDGPGEYEISDISFIGIQSFHDNQKGELRGKNTIYVIEMDEMRILHLGDLGHSLSSNIIEEIGSIDIAFVPVGGYYTIGPKEAVELVTSLEPSIVIPMHYKVEGLQAEIGDNLLEVDEFLKDVGMPIERIEKLSIKKSEIGEGQKVVVLERKV